jgi:hypothetical protein
MRDALGPLVSIALTCLVPSSFAGIGDVFHALVNGATAPITVPTNTLINAVKAGVGQAPPGAILDPAKNAANNTGQLISQGTALAALPQQEIFQKAQEMASHAGPVGNFVFDVATFTHRYEQDLVVADANARQISFKVKTSSNSSAHP